MLHSKLESMNKIKANFQKNSKVEILIELYLLKTFSLFLKGLQVKWFILRVIKIHIKNNLKNEHFLNRWFCFMLSWKIILFPVKTHISCTITQKIYNSLFIRLNARKNLKLKNILITQSLTTYILFSIKWINILSYPRCLDLLINIRRGIRHSTSRKFCSMCLITSLNQVVTHFSFWKTYKKHALAWFHISSNSCIHIIHLLAIWSTYVGLSSLFLVNGSSNI